jgi:hypothetical protein
MGVGWELMYPTPTGSLEGGSTGADAPANVVVKEGGEATLTPPVAGGSKRQLGQRQRAQQGGRRGSLAAAIVHILSQKKKPSDG